MTKKMACYTVAEAARELAVTTSTIYTWLREGKLQRTQTIGGSTGKGHIVLVDAESVLGLRQQRSLAQAEVSEVSDE